MNIIRMSGGLGNQLFSYSLYLKLKKDGREVLIDDKTEYALENRRPIVLEKFGLKYDTPTEKQLEQMTDSSMQSLARIRRKIAGRRSLEHHEQSFNFDEKILLKDPAYLTGCFQSESYFESAKDEVLDAFNHKKINLELIKEEKSVDVDRFNCLRDALLSNDKDKSTIKIAIHIRRGDYLNVSDVYGGICTEDYYNSAIDIMISKLEDEKNESAGSIKCDALNVTENNDCRKLEFYVFSNDLEYSSKWAKEQALRTGKTFELVDYGSEDSGYLDIYLMQLCDHFIIANSSFSWWGSYLAQNENKITIAPMHWLNNVDARSIYRKDMYRIDAKGRRVPDGTLETDPKVSVIVAVYNIESYVERCIKSIISQTYKNLEIILVDDGSTDKSGIICDEFAKTDSRIKVIHKPNGGLSDARNAALEIASGDYIGFVDGDDWIDADMYYQMVTSLWEKNAALCAVRYRQITEDGIVDDGKANSVLLSIEETLDIYVSGREGFLLYNSVWSKLFDRNLIQGMRFVKGKNSEDILFTTEAMCRLGDKKAIYLDSAYYNYVTNRKDSIMNVKAGNRRLQDEMPFWFEQIELFKKYKFDEIAKKALYQLTRRTLFYDVDFRRQGQKEFAIGLNHMLREHLPEISEVYQEDFVAGGDRARLKLYLKSPALYSFVTALYDYIVVPLRNLR